MGKIGIADTTFARINMALFALERLKGSKHEVERYTVPGMKDLPVASKVLLEDYGCDLVIALGMAGHKPIDKQCSHEASIGLQTAQLMTNRHIIEVFVHADEADSDKEVLQIARDRVEKHVENALKLLEGKEALSKDAGTGRRQGKEDQGPLSA